MNQQQQILRNYSIDQDKQYSREMKLLDAEVKKIKQNKSKSYTN